MKSFTRSIVVLACGWVLAAGSAHGRPDEAVRERMLRIAAEAGFDAPPETAVAAAPRAAALPGATAARECAERRLTDASARNDNPSGYSYPRFLKGGDRIVFAGMYSSDGRLFRHDTVGLDAGQPLFYAEADSTAELYARDPAVHRGDCAGHLCVSDAFGAGLLVTDRRTGERRSVSIGPGNHRVPVLTPDGARIIFVYNSKGNDDAFRLMVVGVDGGGPKVLVDGEGAREHVWLPAVSPDGRHVAYAKGRSNGPAHTKSDIYIRCLPR